MRKKLNFVFENAYYKKIVVVFTSRSMESNMHVRVFYGVDSPIWILWNTLNPLPDPPGPFLVRHWLENQDQTRNSHHLWRCCYTRSNRHNFSGFLEFESQFERCEMFLMACEAQILYRGLLKSHTCWRPSTYKDFWVFSKVKIVF